jgi:hypothetical protein
MPATQSQLPKILSAYSDDERVLTLLTFAVGRVLERDFISHGLTIGWETTEIIRHVADWLQASVIDNDEWLERLDDHGRPLKLMKLGTLEAAAKEADKAMRKRAQKLRAVKIKDGDEELFCELADGFYIVRLLTPEALDVESAAMQHCIGQGAYDGLLNESAFAFYSLRDPFGKPHATLEVEGNWLNQCQGKQNREPEKKYLDLMLDMFVREKWKTYIPLSGVLMDAEHAICDAMRLPRGFKSRGSLKLSGLPITSLPADMIVRGDLDIRDTLIERLPDGLMVLGHVHARGTQLSQLGSRIVVTKDLLIQNTSVTTLPADIEVRGSLVARNTKLESFPRMFNVAMSIDLGKTPIRSLPAGLKVHGSLSIDDCPNLTELPNGLVVTGTLNIEQTPISRIPEGAKVGRGLRAAGSAIIDIGTQRTFEQLDLSGTPFSRLPDGVKILSKRGTGSLKLAGCPLVHVGQGLRVVGRADLRDTPLTQIPADMSVKGELVLSGSNLEAIPEGLSVAGTVDVSRTKVKEFPRGLRVTGALIARGLQDLKIGDGLYVGKLFDISETSVVSWGKQGVLQSLRCFDADIAEMPSFMKLSEFHGDRARIVNWPAKLVVDGNFQYRLGNAGTMPAVLTVGMNIDCEDTRGIATPKILLAGGRARFKRSRFQSYSERLEAKSGDFRLSSITFLPGAWRIAEYLLMGKSKLETIEGGSSVGGDFHFDETPLRRRLDMEEASRPSVPGSVRFSR